jgi:putative FmdB family regulatory protein
MPTYDYRCPKCSLKFEAKRPFGDNSPPVFCTRCGAEAKRLFSAVPVIFKGPGFYITDSRKSEPEKKDKE